MVSTRRDETRDRILAAARRLLSEHGYFGVGMDQIARAAGITRQAVYLHHFASKTELLLALIEYVDRVEGTMEIFRPVAQAENGVEALERAIRGVATLAPKVSDMVSVLASARRTDSAAASAWQNRTEARRQGVRGVMSRLKKERRLKPGWSVETATDFVSAVLSLETYQTLVSELDWKSEEFVTRMSDALRGALVREPPARGRR